MLTKGAIGNLVNRYKAVLAKCNLINTFGSLAVASMLVLGGAGVANAELVTDFQNAANNSTIILTKDETVTNYLDVKDKNITIDLNGYSIERSGSVFVIRPNSFLTIKDSSGTDAGTIYSPNNIAVFPYGNITTNNNFKLKIESGTIKSSGIYATIQLNGEHHGSEIEITGGKIISERSVAIYHPQNGVLRISDGLIKGVYSGIEMRAGKIEVSGGTITSTYDGEPHMDSNSSGSTTCGAALVIAQHGTKKDIEVIISGGEFNGQYALWEGNPENNTTDNIKIAITGGIFNGKISSTRAGNDYISGGTFSDETALTYLAPNANITVTDKDIASYANESGDNHTINFGAEGGSNVAKVELAENSTTTFDGKAAIEEMAAGANTTLNINSADITAKTSDLSNTAVTATGDVNDAVGGAEGLANQLGTTVDGIKSLNMEEGLISGAVVNGVQKTNTVMQDTLDMATAAPLAISRIVMNDVRKRMGDLRSTKEESGVWMRWEGGKLKGDAGLTNDFNTIQVGADTKVGTNCRFGVAGAFTHGDLDHRNGEGENETFSFSAYGTWMADNGMFADVIARVGFSNTETTVKNTRIDLDNEVLSLSGEYGWRLPVCEQFFVEPQVELTYTYVSSADSKVQYATYDIDSMDSLIGRAGLVAGWNLPDDMGNVYARASVVREFLGDGKITGTAFGNSISYENDGDDTWLEYGIGANIKLTDKTYIWADVERTAGADLDEEWRGTVGVRYSF